MPVNWTKVHNDGTFITPQPVVEHNGAGGSGWKVFNPMYDPKIVSSPKGFAEHDLPQDIVFANPGEVVRIKMTFDLPGRYVWHCHILSHEDHEMMRYLYVGDLPDDMKGGENCYVIGENNVD